DQLRMSRGHCDELFRFFCVARRRLLADDMFATLEKRARHLEMLRRRSRDRDELDIRLQQRLPVMSTHVHHIKAKLLEERILNAFRPAAADRPDFLHCGIDIAIERSYGEPTTRTASTSQDPDAEELCPLRAPGHRRARRREPLVRNARQSRQGVRTSLQP